MSRYANHLQQKAKLRYDASTSRPEHPRFADEVALNKTLFDMQEELSVPEQAIDNTMYQELERNWQSGGGGSRGDAAISGLKAGMMKGNLSKDKDKKQKFAAGIEKLKTMVEDTNRELWKQERIFNATESIMPRLMSFMKTQKSMDPNAKRVFLQNTLDEYNQAAGTDYKLLGYDGVEPWKVTISDSGESQFLDLMGLMKIPAQAKYEMYLENSPEMQQAGSLMQQEDALDRQVRQSSIDLHQAHANKYNAQNQQQEEAQQRKANLQQQGVLPEGGMLFEEIVDPTERKLRLEELKAEKEKLQPTEAGIKALQEMDKIFKEYPKLSTSLAKWANSKEDTLIGNLLKDIVNKDERNAVQQLEKHAATLALGVIQQFKGQRPTDILKKLIKDTNPGSNFTYKAFIPIKNQYMEQFQKQRAKSMEANNGWNHRYFPNYENIGTNNTPEDPVAKIQAMDPSLTPEMIIEAQRRLSGGQ